MLLRSPSPSNSDLSDVGPNLRIARQYACTGPSNAFLGAGFLSPLLSPDRPASSANEPLVHPVPRRHAHRSIARVMGDELGVRR